MKSQHHQKPKAPPLPLLSCGFFRRCTHTQSTLSPTTPQPPPLPLPLPSTSHPPPPPMHQAPSPSPPPSQNHPKPPASSSFSSSSSSSSSSSQSFTQWKLPVSATSPASSLHQLFQISHLQLSSDSGSDQAAALLLLQRALLPNPESADSVCPPELMRRLVDILKNGDRSVAKAVTKVLLALCLVEHNRQVAVEAGAAGAVVETLPGMDPAAAERALAALELLCMVPGGASDVRSHALAVPVMVAAMGRLGGRGREYAMSVLSVVYGGPWGEEVSHAPPAEVARAVVLALQGECTARGRRKAAQLLKALEEPGRSDDVNQDET